MIQTQIHNKQHLYYIRRCSLWLEYLMLESLLGLFLSAAKVIKDIKTAKELKEKRQKKAKIFKKRQEVKKGLRVEIENKEVGIDANIYPY